MPRRQMAMRPPRSPERQATAAQPDRRALLGTIVAPHGVRGLVKVRSFTDNPSDIVSYGPLQDAQGRNVELRLRGPTKGGLLAAVLGVNDRDAAEAMRGVKLYVPREALPATDDEEEFYYTDLVGLAVETADGTMLGRVKAVHDFGAGDVLEVVFEAGGSELLPFTREMVPVVDLAGGRLVVAGDGPADADAGAA